MSEELPEGWHRVSLGTVAELRLGKMLDKAKNRGAPRPYLRNINVRWGEFDLSNLTSMRFEDAELARYSVAAGDVVVCEGGEPGRAAVWRSSEAMPYQKALHRVRPGPKLDSDFLSYQLRHEALTGELERDFTGSGIAHLTRASLAAHAILLPRLDEQRRIASRITTLLAACRRAREALTDVPKLCEKLRKSVLASAFRGDLTAGWREANPGVEHASVLLHRIRAERRARWEAANPRKAYVAPKPVDPVAEELPELPEGWVWARMEELIEGFDAGRSPRSEGRPAGPTEFGVLKVSAVTWVNFDPGANKAMLSDDMPEAGTTVRAGDLLISRANTYQLVGAVVLVPDDHPRLMLSDKTLRIRYLPSLRADWLLYSLRTAVVRTLFEGDASGTSDSMRNLSQPKIASVPIPIAPAVEQAAIIDALRARFCSVDLIHAKARADLRDLGRLERAILTKAFRGELVDEGGEP